MVEPSAVQSQRLLDKASRLVEGVECSSQHYKEMVKVKERLPVEKMKHPLL